tara:strand:- start:435 stop:770 length:336 start_codon:yes stop_codon:yes gene_type:complete
MIEKYQGITNEFSTFFFKIFIPAFIAISIKIATQIKKETMNVTRIIISFIVGVGCAYFVFPFVDGKLTPLIVGVVSMSGEKIAEYIIYKWDVDKFLSAILDIIIERIRPKK